MGRRTSAMGLRGAYPLPILIGKGGADSAGAERRCTHIVMVGRLFVHHEARLTCLEENR